MRNLIVLVLTVAASPLIACGSGDDPFGVPALIDGGGPEGGPDAGGDGSALPAEDGAAPSEDAGTDGGTGLPQEDDDGLALSRPEGTIPNAAYPADLVNLPREDWARGIVSPTLEWEHHNQPMVVNGYLQLTGNARFSTWDISDPTAPRQLSSAISPDDCKCGPLRKGEAEGHQVAFARYGSRLYSATISGLGIDIWNITDSTAPAHLQSVHLEGIFYGDFTEAVWGVYWQGTTIYVGGTNSGLHVLDARDPEDVKFVKRLPTSTYGNVSAGPVFAVGNVLVVTTPKESGGIATLDISDPLNPIPLDAVRDKPSYIGALYGRHAYLLRSEELFGAIVGPMRVWDVLSDPTTIGAPIATLSTERSEYVSFSDGYMFLGHMRPNPGASKIDVRNPTQMQVVNRIWGRMDLTGNDDQFTVAVGNLLILSDDELKDRRHVGTVIAVHSPEPDTTPPVVDTIIPKNGSTGQSTKSRIGISFTDNIELATVNRGSFIVRPVGGEPIAGSFGLYMGILNFAPYEELQPNTTYEVILPRDGITDYVGNGLSTEIRSTFTTR